jgi:hypothetical protein
MQRTGLLLLTLLSIVAWVISYTQGLSTAYNDAMSHLNIARLVIDNLEPGFAQLGSVWLPLSHLLYLPLVWNDFAWHSGLAGSVVSMVSYVIASVYIYKSILLILPKKSILAALIGTASFALNVNNLYLQSTPLTESLYLALFICSLYVLILYFKVNQPKYLALLGFLGLLQILTRYDGWFVVGVFGALILMYHVWSQSKSLNESRNRVLFYSVPVLYGIVLWLAWNLLIYNDPLYFIFGPYSAHSQQTLIQSSSGLITKHNALVSIKAFYYTMVDNIGLFVLGLGFVGAIAFAFSGTALKLNKRARLLIIAAALSPIVFNVVALFMGFSIINVPKLNWLTSPEGAQYFNVRYGIMALPLAALFIGYIAGCLNNIPKTGLRRALLAILLAGILAQSFLLYRAGVITVLDGLQGSSSFANNDLAEILKTHVGPGERVLLSTSFFNAVAFKSGLPLKQIIHEGVSRQWKPALTEPEKYATWLVLANGDVGEPAYSSLIKQHQNKFLKYYKLTHQTKNTNVYRLKSANEIIVSAQGSTLTIGKNPIAPYGVNSYDLAFKTNREIDESFQELHKAGVQYVRLWAFGEGMPYGLQPEAGKFNEEKLRSLDYVLLKAKEHSIKILPTLVDNWGYYGGKDQYLTWIGKPTGSDEFYTNPAAKNLFKNYINALLSRVNTYTGVQYSHDPNILAWDIMNEPRVRPENQEHLLSWTEEIAAYIRGLDTEHLLTISSDGKEASGTTSMFKQLCELPEIQFCSYHFYFFEENKPLYTSWDLVDTHLRHVGNTSTTLNKPVLITEVGIPKDKSIFGEPPIATLEKFVRASKLYGFNGVLVWNWSLASDDSFGFSPDKNPENIYNMASLQNILSLKTQ